MRVVPAQNRPCGSHLPSFMRFSGKSASTGTTSSNAPLRSTAAKPLVTAAI